MANWWEDAPLAAPAPTSTSAAPVAAPAAPAAAAPQSGGNWWDAAPLAKAAPAERPLTVTPAPQQGWWGTVKDQAGQAAQAADDIVRLTANGMTLGYADKLAALGSGDSVEAERAKSKAAEDRSGWAGTTAEAVGMMSPSSLAGKAVAGVGALGEALPVIGRVLMNPWAQAAATGATVGAGDAAGHDQDIGTGALVGAGAGAAGHAVASAVTGVASKALGLANPKAAIPSAAELKSAAQNAYATADQAGVIVHPSAVARLSDTIKQDMAEFGYEPTMQPKAAGVLSALDRLNGQNVTLKGLDVLRQVAGRLREDGGSSSVLGQKIVNRIDGFTNLMRPADVLAGDAQAGVGALQQARQLWQRQSKAQDLADALGRAELRTSATGSGGNIDNATRQNLTRVLMSRKDWTPDERQAILTVIKGTPVQNLARRVGKLSPEGNGLMMALTGGDAAGAYFTGRPETLALPAAGFAAKRYADWATKANVQRVGDLVATGGDAAAITPTKNAAQRLTESEREALAHAIMNFGISQSGGY